ncbi:MAG: FtsX-like permease family protein [Acidimicrobiales bacterium]
MPPAGTRAPSARLFGLSLLRRALWWRAGSSAAFFAVAIVSVAAATAGPIYLAAADQSVLTNVLSPAPPEAKGLVVSPQPGTVSSLTALVRALHALPASPEGRAWWARPVYSEDLGTTASLGGGQAVAADLDWRSGICHHIVLRSGRCPAGGPGVAMSERSAAFLHARVGSEVTLAGRDVGHAREKVVGVYTITDPTAPYYWGENYYRFGSGSASMPRVDALFASRATVAAFTSRGGVAVSADVPLVETNLFAPDVPALESALSRLETRLGGVPWSLDTTSRVTSLLQRAQSQENAMATSVAVIDLELMLLVLMVLYGVAAGTSAAREHDLALGDLRGLPPTSLARLALREPFALLAVAAPVGAVIGWLAVRAIAPAVLLPGTPVPFDSLAVVTAAAGLVGGMLASMAGSARLLGRSEGAAAITRPRRRAGRGAVALDVFAVAFAIAAIAEIDVSGLGGGTKSSPLATLAPGLVALAVGIVAARLVPLVCRLAARSTTDSPRVATHLSLQRVARRSLLVRQAIVMAIAVSLVYFSAGAFLVARHNRTIESQFQVGAGQVLSVTAPEGSDLTRLVRRADPSGDVAMAAEELSSSSGSLLAVDSRRFAEVAAWPGHLGGVSAAAVAHYLRPRTTAPITFAGDLVRIRADLGGITPSFAGPSDIGRVELQLGVLNTYYMAPVSVLLGPLREGTHTYVASLQGSCKRHCRLESIGLSWIQPSSPPESLSGINVPVVLESLATRHGGSWEPVVGIFAHTGRWRSGLNPGTHIGSNVAGGLPVDFNETSSGSGPAIEPTDVPVLLPAVVTDEVVAANSGSGTPGSTFFPAENLDGATITVDGKIQVRSLPRAGTDAVLVDLSLAELLQTGPGIYATDEVWISPSASAAQASQVVSRLKADGVRVLSHDSAGALERQLNRAGPSLAFILFLVAGCAAALLAAGSLLFAVASSARRRSIELVALGAAGVPSRKLVGALVGELSIVTATGLAAGVVAGIVAAGFALPAVPEFSGLLPGPSLGYGVPAGYIVAVLAAVAVLFLVALAVGVVAVRLGATDDLLRISDR